MASAPLGAGHGHHHTADDAAAEDDEEGDILDMDVVQRPGGFSRVADGEGHFHLESEWEARARRMQRLLVISLSVSVPLVAVLVALVATQAAAGTGFFSSYKMGGAATAGETAETATSSGVEVSRIAFGSCTSTGVKDDPGQPIWTRGVVAAQPDAWIWLGDMAYLDHPTVNCKALPEDPDCVCRDDYMKVEPNCNAGDPTHALRKFQTMLRNPEYNEFLEYMCPGAKERGVFPPTGTDPSVCPRPILGTWDDHDFGWNDGDGRLPEKYAFKQLYLDAIGVPNDSPRRNVHWGIQHKHLFNQGTDREIEVFLLDERYDRVPKPCYVRRQFCEEVALSGVPLNATAADLSKHPHAAWCQDFLHGGHGDAGTCCKYDEQVYFGWCQDEAHRDSPFWEEACDHSSRLFGRRWLVFDEGSGQLREPDGTEEVDSQDSPFCEVLGREQRSWLQRELDSSTAALHLIVSGSVLLGSPGETHDCDGIPCQCSGDDWDCYRPAQRNLLHMLSQAPGCTIVLTGDYHWGDIKVLRPGGEWPYSDWYASHNHSYPIYQVMGSGMTTSTANTGRKCEGFYLDPMGLRDHPECDWVGDPNFGLLEVVFSDDPLRPFASLSMEVHDWDNKQRLQSILTPDMCNPMAAATASPAI